MRGDKQVLRNPVVIPLACVGAPACIAGGLALQQTAPGIAVGLWLTAAILLACLRLSLTLTDEGVIVSNVLPRRYRWDEITRISVESMVTGNPTGGRMLVLDLHGGRRKSAWAVSSGVYKRDWVDQAWAQVHQRWQLALLAAAP